MCNDDTSNGAPQEAGDSTSRSGASRRAVLKSALVAGSAATAAAAGASVGAWGSPASAKSRPQVSGDRLVMLGVDGGPVVRPGLAKPALGLVVGDSTYLVDCGMDTTRQLVESGLGFAGLRNVFITHHHLDHTSGVPDLLLHGWVSRQLPSVAMWGPPGTTALAEGSQAAFETAISNFMKGGGFGPFPTVTTHDVLVPDQVTRVMEDDNVVVDATHVFHGLEVPNAYAYRFTVKATGKVVVFSGDTAAMDANLINLAQGCDFLVHETQDNDRVEELVASLPPAAGIPLRKHLYETHSDVRALPKVAMAAGARALVMSHYTPTPQPTQVYLKKARKAAREIGYHGSIIAPSDLDQIAL